LAVDLKELGNKKFAKNLFEDAISIYEQAIGCFK